MSKRKYTRIGETPKSYQCTQKKCGWQGTDDKKKLSENELGWNELVCPLCYNNEFYGLLEIPELKNI